MAGKTCDYHKNYLFKVEVPGFARAKFQKVGAIEVSVDKHERYEGGSLLPEKNPGKAKVEDVDMERGVTSSTDFWDWFTEVADLVNDEGADDCDDYKRNVVVIQTNRRKVEIRRYTLMRGWPSKMKTGEWDNEGDGHVIETMTVTYDFPLIA